jgi:N-carbamoyl-L-amino-acid hydrolase
MNDIRSLRVDGDRLWASLMAMAEIGATPGGGSNRLALTYLDRDARDLLGGWCREAGAEVSVDGIGNMFARRAGTDASLPPVMAGSHLDTQPMGGRFDGVLGVLAALEVLRTLQDAGVATRHPVELVNWTNEEGARFAPAMIGSGAFAGLQDARLAMGLKDTEGLRFGDELDKIGYRGPDAIGGRPVHAYFELHIEQGPILEDEGLDIGVVTHAQGVRWLDVTLIGAAGHTGTTPMDRRRDALVAAAAMIEAVAEVGRRNEPGVATVGQLRIEPGSRNVIPGRAAFSVDLRHPVAATLAAMTEELKAAIQESAKAAGVEAKITDVLYFAPTAFDKSCVGAVRTAAESCGYRHRDIVSGGGHDACNIARIAPAAMVFCPCIDGVSHTEAENIRPEWATAGANVLLHAILAKAGVSG